MRRWLFRLALGTPFIACCIYLGAFYLLYEQWPWQQSDGAASLVLNAAAQAGTSGATPRHPALQHRSEAH